MAPSKKARMGQDVSSIPQTFSPFVAPREAWWGRHLEQVAVNLEKRGFAASIVPDLAAARQLVLEDMLPASKAKSVSFGGSMTVRESGLFEALLQKPELEVLDTFDTSIGLEAMLEVRRKALLVDFFITSANALTKDGALLLLDGIGNRTAAVQFGPRKVVLLVGRNKICDSIEAGIARIKQFVAPANALRLQRKTPCVTTGSCVDCNSPERICSSWAVLTHCFPKNRVHVVLINKDAGF